MSAQPISIPVGDVGIRFFVPEDAEPLFEAALESVAEVGRWLTWCHPALTVEDLRSWIATQITNREAGTEFAFAVVDGDGAILGGCGVSRIDKEHRFGNLGYWVRSSRTGEGVAVAAARQVARWAFANLELERLEIVCAVGNTRSRRVAEKLGAHREGVLRSRFYLRGEFHDAVLYSILKAEHGKG